MALIAGWFHHDLNIRSMRWASLYELIRLPRQPRADYDKITPAIISPKSELAGWL